MAEFISIKKISIIKIFIFIVIIIAALSFEKAAIERLLLFVILSALFILLTAFKYIFNNKKSRWLIASAFFEIGIIFIMENESRYVINYFLHIIYILALIENAYMFNLKKNIMLQTCIIIVSNVKYIVLLSTMPTFAHMNQFGFFLFINILIAISIDITIIVNQSKKESDLLNKELLLYQDKLSLMATADERNRIARELHDSLGHELSALIMELEITKYLLDKNADESKIRLQSTLEHARHTLSTVRNIVDALDVDDSFDILKLIETFTERTNIDISYEGLDLTTLHSNINETLYMTIKEALTNALKHSQPSQINIRIYKKNPDLIHFKIWNNGNQSTSFQEGFGLTNMRRRIQQHNGELSFESKEIFSINGYVRSVL